jgi:mono/diheme cytochrome c family protein
MFRFRRLAVAAMVLFGLAASAAWIVTAPHRFFAPDDPRLKRGNAEKGRLIFAASQCSSCHATPGQPDRLKLGGGLAMPSPYGTFRIPNISPDLEDGIGNWSVADLGNALVSGTSPTSEHYYPIFPYPSYTSMRFEDIGNLYAYLQSLKPVSGRAPPHDLSLFFSIRRLVGSWKLLFLRERRSSAVIDGDPVHDRGAYLAETLAHCAECHSSRNMFGAVIPETRFAGGVDQEGTGFIPNITPDRLHDWSEADIVRMLKTGETPNHGRIGSSMADVVINTAMLPDADLEAIARYIKSLPPKQTPKP